MKHQQAEAHSIPIHSIEQIRDGRWQERTLQHPKEITARCQKAIQFHFQLFVFLRGKYS